MAYANKLEDGSANPAWSVKGCAMFREAEKSAESIVPPAPIWKEPSLDPQS